MYICFYLAGDEVCVDDEVEGVRVVVVQRLGTHVEEALHNPRVLFHGICVAASVVPVKHTEISGLRKVDLTNRRDHGSGMRNDDIQGKQGFYSLGADNPALLLLPLA